MEQNKNLVVVIMAGGSGTRFWPVSTETFPKQFLSLFGDRSMLQMSFDRVKELVALENILVLTGKRFADLVKEQLPELPKENIIGEPIPRDTSGAIALASIICKARFENSTMLVITADHLIEPVKDFHKIILSAAKGAENSGALYTFGITPTYPANSYGYLETGDKIDVDSEINHYNLSRFKEKPSIERAKEFLDKGNFFWNSGMFVWQTESIWNAIESFLPKHAELLAPLPQFDKTTSWEDELEKAFTPLEKISIDFGVMEKAEKVRMIQADFNWNDVGGWLALEEFFQPNEFDNRTNANLKSLEANNNFVFCEDTEETVALIGIKDLIVVRSGDRTLVTHRDQSESIKKIVEAMKK